MDLSTVSAAIENGTDLVFRDKKSGNPVLAFRSSFGSNPTTSAQDNLIATGTNQATALAIQSLINRFSTVAANTGTILPPSQSGLEITICNAGLNTLQVYGNGADTINGTAGATGVGLASGKTATYFSASAGTWHQQLSA